MVLGGNSDGGGDQVMLSDVIWKWASVRLCGNSNSLNYI